ncbi:MAG: hypothetical protein ACRD01_06820 [Terriglobales bacterium]
MHRNITIRISEEAAKWARRKAAEEDTSVSRLVGAMLERQMVQSEESRQGFESWKERTRQYLSQPGNVDASQRWSREETHERRR